MGGRKRKLEMKMRESMGSRMVTFTKRRKGLFRKANQLHRLTGASTAILAFSPSAIGTPYIHADPSFHHTLRRYFLSLQPHQEQEHGSSSSSSSLNIRACLDGMKVDGNNDLDQLLYFKNLLEEMKSNIQTHIQQHQFVGAQLKYIKESEELRRAMEPLELIKRVREIERESYIEPESVQQRDAKQTAAVDLIARLNDLHSFSDGGNIKARTEWQKRKMDRARQRELGKGGVIQA